MKKSADVKKDTVSSLKKAQPLLSREAALFEQARLSIENDEEEDEDLDFLDVDAQLA
jgi:hypothetical protein